LQHGLDLKRAQLSEEQEQPDSHGGIANAGDHERLARSVTIFRVFVPEADQQVAA